MEKRQTQRGSLLYRIKGIYTDDLYVHFDFYNGKQWKNFKNINRVLGVVPSYEEWQKLKEENRALAMGSFPMMLEAAKKIDMLKGVLKECRPYVMRNVIFTTINKAAEINKEDMKLVTQIDEVLK